MKKTIGFFHVFILLQFSLVSQTIEVDSLLFQELNSELLKANDEVILDINFYYGIKNDNGNQLNLQKDGKKIKAIAEFLILNKYSTIEIGSHTDCMGNLIFNEKTSEQRAKNLMVEILSFADSSNFLDLKKRITPRGYGEYYPLEKCNCQDCTEEEHQQNNRIVIKLIRMENPISQNSIPGLKDRGAKGPSFDPRNQVEGKLSIKVCVDNNGFVIPSKTAYAPENSTITDEEVIIQAIETANKWRFKPANDKIACGTITYIIKIK